MGTTTVENYVVLSTKAEPMHPRISLLGSAQKKDA